MVIGIFGRRIGIRLTRNQRKNIDQRFFVEAPGHSLPVLVENLKRNIRTVDRNSYGAPVRRTKDQRVFCNLISCVQRNGNTGLFTGQGNGAAAVLRDVFAVHIELVSVRDRGCQLQCHRFPEHKIGIGFCLFVIFLKRRRRTIFLRYLDPLQRRGAPDAQGIILILRIALSGRHTGTIHNGISRRTRREHSVNAADLGDQRLLRLARLGISRRGVDRRQRRKRVHVCVVWPVGVKLRREGILDYGFQLTRTFNLYRKQAVAETRLCARRELEPVRQEPVLCVKRDRNRALTGDGKAVCHSARLRLHREGITSGRERQRTVLVGILVDTAILVFCKERIAACPDTALILECNHILCSVQRVLVLLDGILQSRVQLQRICVACSAVFGAGRVIFRPCRLLHIRRFQLVIRHCGNELLHRRRRLRRARTACVIHETEVADVGLRRISSQIIIAVFIASNKAAGFSVDFRDIIHARAKAVAAGVQRFVKRLICRVADALRRDQKRAVPVGSEVKPAACTGRQPSSMTAASSSPSNRTFFCFISVLPYQYRHRIHFSHARRGSGTFFCRRSTVCFQTRRARFACSRVIV